MDPSILDKRRMGVCKLVVFTKLDNLSSLVSFGKLPLRITFLQASYESVCGQGTNGTPCSAPDGDFPAGRPSEKIESLLGITMCFFAIETVDAHILLFSMPRT